VRWKQKWICFVLSTECPN